MGEIQLCTLHGVTFDRGPQFLVFRLGLKRDWRPHLCLPPELFEQTSFSNHYIHIAVHCIWYHNYSVGLDCIREGQYGYLDLNLKKIMVNNI